MVRVGRRRLQYLVLSDGRIVFPASLPNPTWVGLVKWLGGFSSVGLVASIITAAPCYITAMPATSFGLALCFATWYLLEGMIWVDPSGEARHGAVRLDRQSGQLLREGTQE